MSVQTNDSNQSPQETTSPRIGHLDILRGFALLGILLMNIQSFSMPGSAYFNPTSWGNFEGVNFWVWTINHLFADAKFMTLFSLLFGAGICLFATNAEQKHGGSAALHYQRNFWLLVFGLLHAYFIWYGDILYTYAMCAFIVYWFRHFSVKWLVVIAMLMLSGASAYSQFVQWVIENGHMPKEALVEIAKFWLPSDAHQLREISDYTGDLSAQFEQRAKIAAFIQVDAFVSYGLWRAGGVMLLGMALFKSGVLSGQMSASFYLKLALLGLLAGLSLTAMGINYNLEHNFALEYSMFQGAQYNYWGSLFTAFGYVGLIYLAIKTHFAHQLQARLAAVGQMAFTNYMLQSVFCTLIFYGHGLSLFGGLARVEQLLVVALIWAIQLWYSPLWLERFRYGPLEWLWRSLTYRSFQPMARH